jgi:hypothetical protein
MSTGLHHRAWKIRRFVKFKPPLREIVRLTAA